MPANLRQKISRISGDILFYLSLFNLLAIIFDFGYDHSQAVIEFLNKLFKISTIIFALLLPVRIIISLLSKIKVRKAEIFLFAFIAIFLLVNSTFPTWFKEHHLLTFLQHDAFYYLIIVLVFFVELSAKSIQILKLQLSPALLFALSFLLIILLGTGLLLLPKATVNDISVLDALFTSTSAVCVTGLIVVDTGSYFTTLGQIFILILIQLGGLGIMTFTSFFAFFFRGESSFQGQIFLKDIANSEKLGEVFQTFSRIVILTLSFEAIGAFLIYYFYDVQPVKGAIVEKAFFSVFHAVSAFCNAGFSTMSQSLYDQQFRYNYLLQMIIALLFILGGLGFPIVLSILKSLKYRIRKLFITKVLGKKPLTNLPVPKWVNLNTTVVVITTVALIVAGTFAMFLLEWNNTLQEHKWYGKIVTAFFQATTPRTAGFNSVDISALTLPALTLTILLMWIGASPGSTGGGVKTSTFALATLNIFSLAKGKDRIEIRNREIPNESVRRAFAIIAISVMIIGAATSIITITDGDKGFLPIVFECISAYSTVGLTMGITSNLSAAGKTVIIITMFVGRVGMLYILIGLFQKVKSLKYRYPSENVFIN